MNDGSQDTTGQILEDLCSEIKELRVVTHSVNRGIGYAFRSAFDVIQTDFVFFNSADLQVKMDVLRAFLSFVDEYDIIVGALKVRRDPLMRIWISKLYCIFIGLLFGLHLKNINALKLINCKVLKDVHIDSENAFCDAELLVKAKAKGYRIGQCPVEHQPRQGGKQKGAKPTTLIKTFWKGLMFAWHFKFSNKY